MRPSEMALLMTLRGGRGMDTSEPGLRGKGRVGMTGVFWMNFPQQWRIYISSLGVSVVVGLKLGAEEGDAVARRNAKLRGNVSRRSG